MYWILFFSTTSLQISLWTIRRRNKVMGNYVSRNVDYETGNYSKLNERDTKQFLQIELNARATCVCEIWCIFLDICFATNAISNMRRITISVESDSYMCIKYKYSYFHKVNESSITIINNNSRWLLVLCKSGNFCLATNKQFVSFILFPILNVDAVYEFILKIDKYLRESFNSRRVIFLNKLIF